VSTHLIPLRHSAHRNPFTEVRAARQQRVLVASATITGILSVAIAGVALVTVGVGA
jgi:hypothetical protein